MIQTENITINGRPLTRTGEAAGGKITLHHLPHELVGQYFEEVTA